MTMITPSYLGETIEYSSLHACRSTLEDPTHQIFRFAGNVFRRGSDGTHSDRSLYLCSLVTSSLASNS